MGAESVEQLASSRSRRPQRSGRHCEALPSRLESGTQCIAKPPKTAGHNVTMPIVSILFRFIFEAPPTQTATGARYRSLSAAALSYCPKQHTLLGSEPQCRLHVRAHTRCGAGWPVGACVPRCHRACAWARTAGTSETRAISDPGGSTRPVHEARSLSPFGLVP